MLMIFSRRMRVTLIPALLLLLLAGCQAVGSAGSQPTLRVASKDFTEEFILGEMYAQLLENAGYTVERKINLGGTPVVHEALLNDQVDLYPEYTGTGLLTVLKLPAMTDPVAVYEEVKAGYEEQYDLTWLAPAPMNNTNALAMSRTRAADLGIVTISDLVDHAADLVLVGPPEFSEREDGIPGLQRVYGDFNFKEFIPVDPGLRYQILANGEADLVTAFSTDGELAANDLIVLEDDGGLWPPYQVAPVVREDVLAEHPDIAGVLNELAPLLTNETMQQLNYAVSGGQREPADVAHDFLVDKGLLDE